MNFQCAKVKGFKIQTEILRKKEISPTTFVNKTMIGDDLHKEQQTFTLIVDKGSDIGGKSNMNSVMTIDNKHAVYLQSLLFGKSLLNIISE